MRKPALYPYGKRRSKLRRGLFRLDTQGRIWASAADGVHIYHPDGTLEGSAKVASVRVDEPNLAGHLQTPDFFDAERNPTLTFVATDRISAFDVVLDPVGGDRFTDSLRCLAEQGRLLVVGGTAETPGAVYLAGMAALRAGVGTLQVATVAPAPPTRAKRKTASTRKDRPALPRPGGVVPARPQAAGAVRRHARRRHHAAASRRAQRLSHQQRPGL